MSLKQATSLGGKTPSLPSGPPYSCMELDQWLGVSFWMPPGDNRLENIHNGHPAPTPPLENLTGMIRYWQDNPEWMNMLDPQSPVYEDKKVEQALYLDFWGTFLQPHMRVLDLGGGVGRMTQWALAQDCEVELVDPDLRSLWRALSMAVGKKGKIDLHWTTGEKLPEISPVDLVIACEVLNYVENPEQIIDNIQAVLKPEGYLLLSVEARWGWAMSTDVATGSLDAFFETGVVHVPGDRWVRTYMKSDLEKLLSGFTIVKIQPSHYCFSGPFEMVTGYLPPNEAIEMEQKFRDHPVASNLNRAWMVIAQKRSSQCA